MTIDYTKITTEDSSSGLKDNSKDIEKLRKEFLAKRKKSKGGCSKFFLILITLIIAGFTILFYGIPALTPDAIRGDFIDAVYIPYGVNEGKLMILTDGSFKFRFTKSSPGSYSTGTKGIFCKTWTYIYDPVEKRIISQEKTPYDDISPNMKLFLTENKIWKISEGSESSSLREYIEPEIIAYETESGEIIIDNKEFYEHHPQTKSGFQKITINEKFPKLDIKTKDGREFVYYPEDDALINKDDAVKYEQTLISAKKRIKLLALGTEKGSEQRKILFLVDCPENEKFRFKSSSSERMLGDTSSLYFFTKSTAKRLLTEQVFLEGYLIYGDSNYAVILHQNQLGQNAERMLTCADSKGNLLWEIKQNELFDDIGYDEKDPFSKMTFLEHKLNMNLFNDLFLFTMQNEGIIGIDSKTGKILWKIKI